MRTFKEDYELGIKSEDVVLEKIKNYFSDDTIKKSESRVSRYDYKSETSLYELKTRTNACKKFPTTLLPKNKVFGDNHIFLFQFTDGLYFLRYSRELFDTFECKPFRRIQRADYNDKEALYYYIPVDSLTHIE
jgi:hypothetical protein